MPALDERSFARSIASHATPQPWLLISFRFTIDRRSFTIRRTLILPLSIIRIPRPAASPLSDRDFLPNENYFLEKSQTEWKIPTDTTIEISRFLVRVPCQRFPSSIDGRVSFRQSRFCFESTKLKERAWNARNTRTTYRRAIQWLEVAFRESVETSVV